MRAIDGITKAPIPLNGWPTKERILWMKILFAGCVLLYASRNILPVCSADIARNLNWTRQDEGLVMGIFFWGYMLTQYAGGYFSDVVGGETVICMTTVIWGFITTIFVFIPFTSSHKDVIFQFFLLARFTLGIFQGFFYPGLASLMAKRVHTSERQFTYAFITSGSHAGTLACGFVGSFLTEAYGWGVPFLLIGSMALLWAALVFQRLPCQQPLAPLPLPRPGSLISLLRLSALASPPHSTPLPNEHLLSASAHDLEKALTSKAEKGGALVGQLPAPSGQSLNWCQLVKQPAYWAMLLGNFVFNNTFYIILNWLPSYFQDNFPDAKRWIFNVVPWLIVVPCTLISGHFADRMITLGYSVTFVRKTMASIALLGTSVFLMILPAFEGFYPSLMCMALVVACCGFHNSGILLNPQDIAPMHGGQVFGVMATVGTIPGFTGVYLTGYILAKTQSWSSVFHFAILGNLLGWMVYAMFGSSRPLV